MSAKLSKEITDCVLAGRYVLSAFEIEGPRVAAIFLDVTRPHHEDDDAEPRPDAFLLAVESKLRASLDHLIEADYAVARAAGLESTLRQRHRDAKRRLALQIVALRRLVLAQYVDPDMENLGLQPVNVRDAMTIQRRAGLVGERFAAVNLLKMLGESRFDAAVDLSPHVAEIRVKAAELLSLLREIDEAHRGADRMRIERNRARETYDRAFLRGTRMFEDMCRFAGMDDLADRVRKPGRRSKTAGDSEEMDGDRGDRFEQEKNDRDNGMVGQGRHEGVYVGVPKEVPGPVRGEPTPNLTPRLEARSGQGGPVDEHRRPAVGRRSSLPSRPRSERQERLATSPESPAGEKWGSGLDTKKRW